MYHLSLYHLIASKAWYYLRWLTQAYYVGHWAASRINKFSFSQPSICYELLLCTSLCMYHLSLSQVLASKSMVLLEILTPPCYDGIAPSVSHTNKVSISQHPPFVTSCYFVYIIMHVPPQPVWSLWRLKHSVTWDIDSAYYERHSAYHRYKQVFSFLNTSICYELYFVYIIMHVPPQPVPEFSV
jgi:hypothetical protein